uniref:Chloroplast violaxanthin de-epoxidase n=1 Tax=Lobosphaera incisa TaxID=312850 RepID=A0A1Y0AWU3_9CHLO|nr:chloroplast violaxanthin de-epoxidase [Lobosphaera incisa]
MMMQTSRGTGLHHQASVFRCSAASSVMPIHRQHFRRSAVCHRSLRPQLRDHSSADRSRRLCCTAHSKDNSRQAWTQQIADGVQSVRSKATSLAAGLLLSAVIAAAPVYAADVAKVGTCLLSNCQVALAQCLADGECLENLVCLQFCNGRPDESGCQIKCGDRYNDKAVETFTKCAVSQKKCVPQRNDGDTVYPVPKKEALDQNFDLNMVQGRWYITAGYNPLFDNFDCQEHYFGVPEPGKLYAKINWRIPKGEDFIERSTVQTFKQRPDNPALLENHGNEFLHYEDDWYILASKPDEYYVVYYKGNNDAWKGYGGATVYSREPKLPEQYIPVFRDAYAKVGLNWDDFTKTDNTCKPHPPPKNLTEVVLKEIGMAEKLLGDEVKYVEYTVENDLKSFGRGFTVFETNLTGTLQKDEEAVARELREAEQYLEGIERQYLPPSVVDRLMMFFQSIFGGGNKS